MNINIPVLILEIIIASIPLILIKKFTITRNYFLLLLSLLCYVIMIWCYVELFTGNNLAGVYVLVHVSQFVLLALVGLLFLHERLTFPEVFGVILGMASIYLLINHSHSKSKLT